jgi:hypothetical protein
MLDYDPPEPQFAEPQFIDIDTEPEKIWTLRRFILLLVAILVIVSLMTVFYLAPLLASPSSPPQPLVTPTVLPLL